jgi:NAD(P)-dependent dehydrogenase (short-subunit alcohol dehydrogenase family)
MMQSPFTLRTDVYPAISPSVLTGTLTGKNALVTGSGRGIGRLISIALAQAGASVAITGRTAKEVESTTQEISELIATSHAGSEEDAGKQQAQQQQQKVIGITADVLKRDDQERLIREFHTQLGQIDILILNAGSNVFLPFHLTDADGWWDVMELNVRAPVELTRLVVPEMMQRNTGTIIYTSSRAATANLPWTTSYNCAKTAITRFAGTLQAELDQVQKIEHKFDRNAIEVFSIHPGEIETGLHQTAFPEKTKKEAPYVIEHMEMIGKKRPHFQGGLPAWTCVWLCAGKGEELKGAYVDCTRDVEEQAAAVGKK